MCASKLSASELSKQLAQKKETAKEKMRLERIEAARIKKEQEIAAEKIRREAIEYEEQLKAEESRIQEENRIKEEELQFQQKFRDELLAELSEVALAQAVDGQNKTELSSEAYQELEEYLENDLGFKVSLQSQESYSKNFLNRKLNRLTSEELFNLSTFLRGIVKNIELLEVVNLKRISNIQNHLEFCETLLIFLSLKQNELSYRGLSEYEDAGFDHLFGKQVELAMIIYNISDLIDEYVPRSWLFDRSGYRYFLQWSKKPKSKNYNFWFNAENLHWITSEIGQYFFNRLLAQIEVRIELLKSNISFQLLEVNSVSTLIFENNESITAPIRPIHMLSVFESLGYSQKWISPRSKQIIKLTWA
jgi:hypothetical protein